MPNKATGIELSLKHTPTLGAPFLNLCPVPAAKLRGGGSHRRGLSNDHGPRRSLDASRSDLFISSLLLRCFLFHKARYPPPYRTVCGGRSQIRGTIAAGPPSVPIVGSQMIKKSQDLAWFHVEQCNSFPSRPIPRVSSALVLHPHPPSTPVVVPPTRARLCEHGVKRLTVVLPGPCRVTCRAGCRVDGCAWRLQAWR